MDKCVKQVPGTELRCGQKHGVYCSDECAKAIGQAELAELGITPEMMKEALDGYYECRELIEHRGRDHGRQTINQPTTPPRNPYESGPG